MSCYTSLFSQEEMGNDLRHHALPYSFVKDDSLQFVVWNPIETKEVSSNKIEFEGLPFPLVLKTPLDAIPLQSKLEALENSTPLTIYTTEFPIIHITTTNTIKNEPKVKAQFRYYDKDTTFMESIGIEWRGNISLTFPKKTYDIEFRESEFSEESKDVKFPKLRRDDDYVLDGLYNEPLRVNAKISIDLWKAIHAPSDTDVEKKAPSGGAGNFVELFINNKYRGLYLLQDQVDRKLLKLKKKKNDTARGLLYKAGAYQEATKFEGAPTFKNSLPTWSGFEMEYPYENYEAHWAPLAQAIALVATGTEDDFKSNISTYFDINNVIDYYLFVNLCRATDNLGKNYYLARYTTDSPFTFVPWDLDGTWGTVIDGRRMNIVEDILSNQLFDRLWEVNPDNYIEKVAARWQVLREHQFSETALHKSFNEYYTNFTNHYIYERESLYWENKATQAQLEYTLDWISRRLEVLDAHFKN